MLPEQASTLWNNAALADCWVTLGAGCIFEVSKRRRMPLLVTLRLAGAACEVAFCGGHPLLLIMCLSCACSKHGIGHSCVQSSQVQLLLQADRRPRPDAAFGTWVVFGTDVRCRVPSTGLEWNPKKEVMILVLLTWGLEALTLCALPSWSCAYASWSECGLSPVSDALCLQGWQAPSRVMRTGSGAFDPGSRCIQVCTARRVNLLLWYNAWPEHHAPESWERRFIFLGRWLCCQAAPSAQAPTQGQCPEFALYDIASSYAPVLSCI